jgi:hypothetical protein
MPNRWREPLFELFILVCDLPKYKIYQLIFRELPEMLLDPWTAAGANKLSGLTYEMNHRVDLNPKIFTKFFKIPRHIESLDACMKH